MKDKQRRLIDKLKSVDHKPGKAMSGSARMRRRQDRLIGKLHRAHGVRVSLYLRRRSARDDAETPVTPEGRHLTHDEFEAVHGAHPEDMQRVLEFAAAHEMEVLDQDPLKRRVRLKGTPDQIKKAFNVDLLYFERPDGRHHGHEGPVHVPESLEGIVTSVFGLDTRPVARKQSPRPTEPRHRTPTPRRAPARRKSTPLPKLNPHLTPLDVGKAYNFPSHLDGSGQCIGLVQLDGGFDPDELKTYFAQLGVDFDVDKQLTTHGENRYGKGAFKMDAEVTMDIELAASLAPGAKFVVYFAEDNSTDARSFVDTVIDAIHDKKHTPSVVSISWASPEYAWADADGGRSSEAQEMAEQIRDAAEHLRVTVCVSSGDYGSLGSDPSEWPECEDYLQVTFPGSVPHALACGGTTLHAPKGRYARETAWEESTGGISAFFERPGFQKTANVPPVPDDGYRPGFKGAGVPDVAGHAELYKPGYMVLVHGHWAPDPDFLDGMGGGGTSAAAPVWAALVARLSQGLGRRLGFLNPELYALMGTKAFHPITEGKNGDDGRYDAGPGWNAVTGLGTPNGMELLKLLE